MSALSESNSCRLECPGRAFVDHARLTLRSLHLTRANDPPLVGLLRIFKDYYPEIIVAEAVRGKASAFKVCHTMRLRSPD